MITKSDQICRLCLKRPKNAFEKIDKIGRHLVKQIFHVLFLKLDLDLTRDPIICQRCVEVAKKCLNFKYNCIDTERIVLLYSGGKKEAKHNINVIYNEKKQKVFDEILNICRMCMTRLENDFISLDTLMIETTFGMLSKYMPEMNFNVIENPIICTVCKVNLENYVKFVLNCLNIERKIEVYCKKEGTGSRGQVKLTNVLNFFDKSLKDADEWPKICANIGDSTIFENAEYVCPEASIELIKLEEWKSEEEENNLEEGPCRNISEIMLNQLDDTFPLIEYEKESKWDSIERVQSNMMQDSTHSDAVSTGRTRGKNKVLKCSLCTYEAKRTGDLTKHMLVHKDVSELKMYKCSLCAYEAKKKCNLNSHMLVHKDVSEIQMHKCSMCAFEAKRKGGLRKHMLVHKDVSEIKMYKCSLCAYEAKKKCNLEAHMLVHKDVSEIKMHKCSLCTYEAKTKIYLRKHMLIHKSLSEGKLFKCSLCAYEANRKPNLKTHMLTHKDVSELKMFKCSTCTYKSKQKCALVRHMLVHKDVSKIKMYKCSLCPYEAKRRSDLIPHMLVHKDVSESRMYNCSFCTYEAKRKGDLTKHLLVHKDISEIKTYKCSLCAYKAKKKFNLKTHMLVHKSLSERKMFTCSLCGYEAYRKSKLKTHMLAHEDLSELQMFKCS